DGHIKLKRLPMRSCPPKAHWQPSLFIATAMKDFANASFPPEVISVMEEALDAAVASLPEPVHSTHVQCLAEAILRAADKADRERVIGAAEGRVIEIGIGSGRNLPFYRPPVQEVLALEPSAKLIAMARHALHPGMPVSFIEASAEAIPLDDDSVDTVVTTWTLCSIPDAAMALTEMRRVLRPNGK